MIAVTKTYLQALPKGSWDGHHLFPGKNYCFMLTSHPRLPWTEIRQGFSAKIKTSEANWEDQPPNKWNFISCLSGGCCERGIG